MATAETEAKKTPLYDQHRDLGAKIVPFAGYLMPLQYSGQIAEHEAVRKRIGIFDLSHMGEFRLTGTRALEAADRLVTNKIADIPVGQAVYSPMCREDGGIVDDLIVYRLEDSVLLVVNGANIDKDEAWVQSHLLPGVKFRNETDETALIAVQGPETEPFLQRLTEAELAPMGTYTAKWGEVCGIEVLISRTGYTGEDGFELYVPARWAADLWAHLMEEGKGVDLLPIGLAARDTLRFEMGYCLYGNDIDDSTTPLEAGLSWTVKLNKENFIGREALVKQKDRGVSRRLVGLVPQSPRCIPRKGYPLVDAGTPVGEVTSGTFAPSLNQGLGMGYVQVTHAEPGRAVGVDIRGRVEPAAVTRFPFYGKGSRKAPAK
jgi:aminomethyltransferase